MDIKDVHRFLDYLDRMVKSLIL